jgi:signal transduction histidine kinase
VEVLRDTALDKSQKDLLGMIDSCASTLLFTMNHLLDFSKINDLDRVQSRSRVDSHGETSPDSPRNTFGQASEDYLCRVVQGVVEGVWYGHDREQAAHELESSILPQDYTIHFDTDSTIVKHKDVAIFLYMESHAAWFSMVSAGAWKRLVMNLFGNSLKFCQRGHIEVTLNMVPNPKDAGKKMAHLTVSDTGIGMSESFLKHALYRPFIRTYHFLMHHLAI